MKRTLITGLIVFSLLMTTPAFGQAQPADKFTPVAQNVIECINAGDYEKLAASFDDPMKAGFPLEKMKAFFSSLTSKNGKIERFDPPRIMSKQAYSTVQALFLIHFERGAELDMKIILDDRGLISGLGFLPIERPKPAATAPTSKTQLHLPMRGLWVVQWGGDTRELNPHHDAPNQTFAFDFMGMGPDGKLFKGDGSKVGDYYGYGRQVVAPAGGTIRVVIDGVPDNAIGSLNPYSALGNAILVEHSSGEVSVVAHLQPQSLRVKVGDHVSAGEVIGLVGNSGNSTKPHLHYHLQNSAVIQDGKAIKVLFRDVVLTKGATAEPKREYSPVKDDIISADEQPTTRQEPGNLPVALFKAGKFAEADAGAAGVLRHNRRNFEALIVRARVALYANRLGDAQQWARTALRLKPDDKEANALTAQCYYRQDQFTRAAPYYERIGQSAVAKQMASFRGLKPYRLRSGPDQVKLPLLYTDPLPVVSARINGSPEVKFLIDTGGSEMILDPEFAKSVGIPTFGSQSREFGGGKQSNVEFGRATSVQIGYMIIENVPVQLLSTRAFSGAAHGERISGVIGTVFLYHFLATIDYPGATLVLRRKDGPSARSFSNTAAGVKTIPFWLAGDHFMVAWGTVSNSAPVLLFVDTGLAGGGYTGPESMLREVGIKPEEDASEGAGGGGMMKIVPFTLDRLQLGSVRAEQVRSFYGPFPPSLEYHFGFRLAGIVSHQFFRPYALTLDFRNMQLLMVSRR